MQPLAAAEIQIQISAQHLSRLLPALRNLVLAKRLFEVRFANNNNPKRLACYAIHLALSRGQTTLMMICLKTQTAIPD